MQLDEKIIIKPLGAGNEVGRSCIHVKYNDKELLLDCGVHPAHTGVSSLPFLDLVDLSKIDAILITHFHLDHAAALPFLTEKTEFKGQVYMTHPTKAILKWLLNDYIRVINSSAEQDFYTEQDLLNCYNKIIPIDYHQQTEVKGIKFTALNAGHVLGAAMFLIEIEKSKLLYTGDFSREEDRHLKAAESPGCTLDAMITESTYGVQCHLPRSERESRFTSVVSNVVERGGRCLLPVFALGRAQELLLILEEHWEDNPHLKGIPIYYASALAKRCMSVYQTYINMMNERIQKINLNRNPFDFKHVQNLKDILSFKDEGPCVIMASPGMLQSGFSRELFEKWCSNAKNGVVIPGYCVEGTLAKEILSEPKEIESMRGSMLKLNMSVEYISFSAHVDYTQNSQFIDECKPKNLFFVHGEANEMLRLKNTINLRNEKNKVEMNLFALKNGEEGSFVVNKDNTGKIYTEKKGVFEALAVVDNEEILIFDKENLQESEVKLMKLKQTQSIPYNSTFTLLKQILVSEFDAEERDGILFVENIKIVSKEDAITLEWESSYLDDVIAMAINKSIKEIGQSVKSVRLSRLDEHDTLLGAIKCYYNDVKEQEGSIVISWKDKRVTIKGTTITGNDDELVAKVCAIVDKVKLIYN
jgi:cleavage and polyadenylation specificity factor subunit 3